MKVGDLVKLKNKWKNVEYNPQEVKNRIGVIIARSREYGWKVYWIADGGTAFEFRQDLEVINENRQFGV